ncbi:MAG: hypothetical protein K2J52_07790, partial [Duncaniella sp.]|nr:hypothetical protein [Duncaniella sp.]
MTKDDYSDLRISRVAGGRHLTDTIDRLLDRKVPAEVYAATMTAVYRHILDGTWWPGEDTACDTDVFAGAVAAISCSARRSASAREAARRRRERLLQPRA